MPEKPSKRFLLAQLSILYGEMEEAYDRIAAQLGLSCEGCTHNCCTSYFLHHTYIEWAYLWDGIEACEEDERKRFLQRARTYVRRAGTLLAKEMRPDIMCPLNEEGLCRLYNHRLMICRMHGVPNTFVRPDGKRLRFPGCRACQELYESASTVPVLDRTNFYRRLATLEKEWLQEAPQPVPRVKLTLAEMLANGPPNF